MPSYLVTYDLINERSGHDYKPLTAALTAAGGHRTQYSAWLVASKSSAQAAHDHVKRFLDNDDRLWVTRVRPSEYWYSNAIGGTKDWLKRKPLS